MEQLKSSLKFYKHTNHLQHFKEKTNRSKQCISPCNGQGFPMEDFYPSELWSTLLVDSTAGNISIQPRANNFATQSEQLWNRTQGKTTGTGEGSQRMTSTDPPKPHQLLFFLSPGHDMSNSSHAGSPAFLSCTTPGRATPVFMLHVLSHGAALWLMFILSSSIQLWLLQQQRTSTD